MTRLLRFTTFSLLGCLPACGSTDDPETPYFGDSTTTGNAVTDGAATTSTTTTSGTQTATTDGTATTGTSGTATGTGTGTGGAGTTGGATDGVSSTLGGSGGGGSTTTGVITSTTGTGGEGTGGEGTGGTTTSTTGGTPTGDISINDPVPGFASVAGGTTGGGTDLGSAVRVNSMGQLTGAASGSNPTIILVEPGEYNGTLAPGPNKTIIGTGAGVTLTGNISISGVDNVIIRNLAVRGLRCNSYDECRAGADAVYIGNGAHHVWLDHLDIADGQDGNCDITQGGDYITVSWTHFHYTYAKEHRFSNLIAGSDNEPNSVGKLRITYMTSHWGERVDQRQPRGRFGDIHMLNNYHDSGGSAIHGVGVDMALIAENCVYDEHISIWKDMGSPRGWQGIGNEGSASGLNDARGSVFDIPYEYTAMPASEVVAAVTSPECGAGNTCSLAE